MVNLFNSYSFNKLLLSCVLTTFSMAVVTSPPCYAVCTNDIAFLWRTKELVEKVWKYQEKEDTNKVLDAVLDIKQEIEAYEVLNSILIKSLIKQKKRSRLKVERYLKKICRLLESSSKKG